MMIHLARRARRSSCAVVSERTLVNSVIGTHLRHTVGHTHTERLSVYTTHRAPFLQLVSYAVLTLARGHNVAVCFDVAACKKKKMLESTAISREVARTGVDCFPATDNDGSM